MLFSDQAESTFSFPCKQSVYRKLQPVFPEHLCEYLHENALSFRKMNGFQYTVYFSAAEFPTPFSAAGIFYAAAWAAIDSKNTDDLKFLRMGNIFLQLQDHRF